MKYDAFISYRHTDLDMKTAKKLHNALETFHVPKSVQKKTGKKNIKRVFRDQEELPIGSDLNDNISDALRESEYLIVICSPNTPGSYWVNKEIDTFIEMHDRSHILAVLVDGEPDESFPKQILINEEGKPVEPLAADIRGKDSGERNKKFKTEFLRIAAPVLGCTYDDLKQRHRERIIKRNVIAVGILAAFLTAAGTAFGVYNANVAEKMRKLADEKAGLATEKTRLADDMSRLAEEKGQLAEEKTMLANEIMAEYVEKQKSQSKFFAQESLNVLAEGNRRDAALIAAAGLPQEDSERPYVAEAEYALASALHAYDSGMNLSYDRILSHDLTVRNMWLSDDSSMLVTIDSAYNVYVWDTVSWELKTKIPAFVGEDNFYVYVTSAMASKDGIYLYSDKGFYKYSFDGDCIVAAGSEHDNSRALINTEIGSAYLFGQGVIDVLDIETGNTSATINIGADKLFSEDYVLRKDNKYIAVDLYHLDESAKGEIVLIDTENNSSETLQVSNNYVSEMCFTDNGNLAVVSFNGDFILEGVKDVKLELIDPDEKKILWTTSLDMKVESISNFETLMESHSYESGGEQICDVVIVMSDNLFTVNEKDGSIRAKSELMGCGVTLSLNQNSTTGFVAYEDGNVDGVNTTTGKIIANSRVETGVLLREMLVMDGQIVLRAMLSNEIYILKYLTAPDLTSMVIIESAANGEAVSPNGDYFVLRDSKNSHLFTFFSSEGEYLYTFEDPDIYILASSFYENRFAVNDYEKLVLIDPVNQNTEEILFSDIGLDQFEFINRSSFTRNGKYLVLWKRGANDINKIFVIDVENKQIIYNTETELELGYCALSEDGSRLMVSRTGKGAVVIDIATSNETELDESIATVSDCYSLKHLAMSPDGKHAVMACMDGTLRAVNVDSNEILAELTFQAKSRCFISYTSDGKFFLAQGDDYELKIFDASDYSFVGTITTGAEIKYFIEDPDGYIAICDGYNAFLLNADSMGLVAEVPGAITYLQSDNSFVVYLYQELFKTGYKDYKTLLAEAERQFGSLDFTYEERVKYNVFY